jgi:hypothetical protein
MLQGVSSSKNMYGCFGNHTELSQIGLNSSRIRVHVLVTGTSRCFRMHNWTQHPRWCSTSTTMAIHRVRKPSYQLFIFIQHAGCYKQTFVLRLNFACVNIYFCLMCLPLTLLCAGMRCPGHVLYVNDMADMLKRYGPKGVEVTHH